jgi:uncharacterized protein with FMN-binding domain
MEQIGRLPRLRRGGFAVAAVVAAACSLGLAPPSARATAEPGQPVNDDYGQSDAEVAAEVATAVAADPKVIAAKAVTSSARSVLSVRKAAYSKAYANYLYAKKHPKGSRLARAVKALAAAKTARTKAQATYNALLSRQNAVVASATAAVRAQHYRPIDGVYLGALRRYLVPSVPISFEPMQVQVTVYGGHVSDVTVTAQADASSDSASYNTMSLTTLMLEAMAADGSASIAAVSGASLSSEAFTQSLQSALVSAGFHA